MAHDRILKSFKIVSAMTALSRLTGYLRDSILALCIGPGSVLDAFFIVSRIASMGRAFFAEGMVQALVPVLTKEISIEERKKIIFVMGFYLSSVLLLICTLVTIYSNNIINVIAPGFKGDRYFYSVYFLRIMFWYLFQISLVSLYSALLNIYNKFAIPSIMPAILNIVIISFTLPIGYGFLADIYLAYSVVLAGFVQLLVIFIVSNYYLGSFRFSVCFYHRSIKSILKVMFLALAGTGIVQFSSLMDALLATSLPEGSVSWVYYSDRLLQFPLGILGVSMATVLLPKLSESLKNNNQFEYDESFIMAFEFLLILGMPVMLLFVCCSKSILLTLFTYGKFLYCDAIKTSQCLTIVSLSVPFILLSKLLSASSYAKGHINSLVYSTLFGVLSNVVVAFSLRGILMHQAMSCGMLVGAVVNAVCLYYYVAPIKFYLLFKSSRMDKWIVSWLVMSFWLLVCNFFMPVNINDDILSRFINLFFIFFPACLYYLLFVLEMFDLKFSCFVKKIISR